MNQVNQVNQPMIIQQGVTAVTLDQTTNSNMIIIVLTIIGDFPDIQTEQALKHIV
jgi:hypothetical protein